MAPSATTLVEQIEMPQSISSVNNEEPNMKHAKVNGSEAHGIAKKTSWLDSTRNGDSTPETKVVHKLYAPEVTSKIWSIAERDLSATRPPCLYPEYTHPGATAYVYRELDFWTSGFFPGSLHLLLQRRKQYSHELQLLGLRAEDAEPFHTLQLEMACNWWTENLHQNASIQGTHDIGFMLFPWASIRWELERDHRSLDTLMKGAETLASRFSPKVGCIRSWDTCQTKCYDFQDPESEFMVIIDNMMNLNMIFWAAAHTNSITQREHFLHVATTHARTTQRSHIREDASTSHLVVFEPDTGDTRSRLTNQGLHHNSCWSRGQAWAIAGFAETYQWTKDVSFLDTARECADYFIRRLPRSNIPPWDFDACGCDTTEQPPDTSAAMIAAYGMLLIHQAMTRLGMFSEYLKYALRIVEAVCANHLNPGATWSVETLVVDTVESTPSDAFSRNTKINIDGGDTILNGATINNFEFAPRRWANHGLVYADYYFLLFGNKLLEMGLAGHLGARD